MLQGNCTGPVPQDLLEAWQAHIPGPPPALKPGQCLVLAPSKALFAQNGQLWLHNLYFASTLALPTRQALLLSTGYQEMVELLEEFPVFAAGGPAAEVAGWEACARPTDLRLYMTDVVLHCSPHGGSFALGLLPLTKTASVSLFASGAHPTLRGGSILPPAQAPHTADNTGCRRTGRLRV